MSKDYSIRKQIAWFLSSQLIVILFLQNSQLQRDIYQTIFSPIILWILRKFLQRIKKTCWKFLKSLHKKKTPVASSYFSKVVGFYRSSHLWFTWKMMFLERCSQNSQGNIRDGDYFLIKGCKKETPTQVFSVNFAKLLRTPFFTEHLQTTASAFSFSQQIY